MSEEIQARVETRKSLRDKLAPWILLSLVLALTLAIFFLARRFPEQIAALKNYGYLGIFIVSMISNASIILPVPGILIFTPLLGTINPVLAALVGSTGGTIGESTAYLAGLGGRAVINDGWLYRRVDGWMKRWGIWAVFFIAAAPFLPVDVAGMIAGALRFSYWKFMLAVWAGKSLKYIVLMLLAAWGLAGMFGAPG